MKIASILPYKENYTSKGAGAVSLWVKDFMKFSKYKNKLMISKNPFQGRAMLQKINNIS